MKKRIIFLIIIVVLFVLGISSFVFKFFDGIRINFDEKNNSISHTSLLLNQVSSQITINEKLNKISKNKEYSFSSPYVELNPYLISPLSAIIIFYTEEEVAIDLYINEYHVTTLESTNHHTIPIYGLLSNYDNKIKLVAGEEVNELTIKTEKDNIRFPLVPDVTSKEVNNEDFYFTVASFETFLTAWDNQGNLRFYLTVDNRMDVEWLDNGHFLIGISDGEFAENFLGFVEMDYLGKIYNYYTMPNGYSFEFQVLSNGEYMIAGGNNPVYIDEQVVYTMNPSDGSVTSLLNLSEAILKIDPDFNKTVLGQKAIRNAFAYNETTNELVMSFRGMDAIISYNYNTGEINYVFTNPNNELFANPIWKDYLVKLNSGRYPEGQHSVILTSDGNIGLFNNGYNRYHGFENGGNDLVSYYENNYSSGEVYKIENRQASLVFSFHDHKKLFSHQYGSIKEYGNNYLIDFGYNLKDEYRTSISGTLSAAEASQDNIYTKIVEIDKNNNVVFSATSEEGKFRAFKHSFYNKSTSNVNLQYLNVFNNIKKDKLRKVNIKNLKIEEKQEWINDYTLTLNAFKTNYNLEDNDIVKFYFINKKNEVYEFIYKDKNSNRINRIFNLDLKSDTYVVYISINDTLYELDSLYDV